MVKNLLPVAAIVFFASCSSLKPLNFTSNKQAVNASTESNNRPASSTSSKQAKFIENITVTPSTEAPKVTPPAGGDRLDKKETYNTRGVEVEAKAPVPSVYGDRSAAVEMASPVQLKYAILLNTEVEQLQNKALLESVDEWYGTRYRLGGTTKKGIDCSAFVQASFLAAYGISLPRTAREQYRATQRISRTELKEGDLVFFNTRGGVSHVGIYLQNNKFIHASTSQGVVVSDMFDTYYLKRYVGAGRMETSAAAGR